MNCDVNNLSRLSSCFRCLTDGQLMQIRTYLLCQFAQRGNVAASPAAPTNLDITFASNQANVVLTWTNPATPGSSNEVWKSTDGINFNLFTTVGGGVATATDATGMANQNIWYYKVRACNSTNCSAFSSVVSASFNFSSVVSVSFPTLVRAFGNFTASNQAAITSISLPALKSCLGNLNFSLNPNCTSVTLTSLATVGGSLFFGLAAPGGLIGAFTLPALISTTGDLQFQQNNITSFSAPVLTTIGGNLVAGPCPLMTSLSLPNCGTIGQHVDFNTCPQLTSVNLTQLAGGGSLIDFHGCSSLVSLNLPNVADVQQVLFTGCTVLQTFTMPTLATIRNTYNGSGNAALVTLGIGVAIFTLNNSTINMSSCALNAASINAILARGVASAHTAYTYTLNLGTNAAPSGQGVADKATLIGQGNTVTTN